MRLRVLAIAAAAVAAPLACVDLFHSTDFETARDAALAETGPTGDASVDAGPKPLVDFCKWTPAEAKANATRACAWLGACGGPIDESRFGRCMMHALWAYDCSLNPALRPKGKTEALWSCLSDVKGCSEVSSCVGLGNAGTCDAVLSGAFTKCGPDASTLRFECGKPQAGPPTSVEPCALYGKTCARIDDSTSTCSGATGASCAEGKTCTGTGAVDCLVIGTTLVDVGVDCAAFGEGACAADALGVACVPQASAPPCDGGSAVTCEGDGGGVATSCVGGRRIAVDCAMLAVPCDVTTDPIPAYAPLQACAEKTDAGRCSSTADDCVSGKVRGCGNGITFEADCASLGLGACERVGDGTIARCAAP